MLYCIASSYMSDLKFLIITMQFSLPKLQAGVESHLVLLQALATKPLLGLFLRIFIHMHLLFYR